VRRIAVLSVPALAAVLVTAPGAAADLRLASGVPHVSKAGSQPSAAKVSVSAARKDAGTEQGAAPLWATINICDTKRFPNAFGVRVSVPGNRTGRRVYARFSAQSWNPAKQRWLSVAGTGKSDWVYVGLGDRSANQGGWTFHLSQPRAGTTYLVRGLVELNWREEVRASGRRQHRRARWSVVERRVLVTETGKSGVKGGDPAGTSKTTCLIW
jgi:hypothetical protein